MVGLDFRPDHDELLGLRIRKGSEECCVIDGKDGGVGADADGKCEQNGEGQTEVSSQHTEAETDVLKKSLHSVSPCK